MSPKYQDSLLLGLCYAEFGARVPRAGSAYIYSYVCIGEFAAFVIGWNLILEYIIGSASVARGLSLYLDSLLNNTMQTAFRDIAPIDWGFLGTYFDFFAFGSAFLLGGKLTKIYTFQKDGRTVPKVNHLFIPPPSYLPRLEVTLIRLIHHKPLLTPNLQNRIRPCKHGEYLGCSIYS